MTTYIQALTALQYLFDNVGENHWRDWLRQDIMLWETDQDVSHHLSAYGGMGSINDVWICAENKHRITKIQEPWANHLLDLLKALCHRLAKTPNADQDIMDVIHNRRTSLLNPLKENAAAQISMPGVQLHGWRCLNCGYGEVNTYEIEDYLAKIVLPDQLKNARTEQDLITLVDSALAFEFEDLNTERNQIKKMVADSSINIGDREGWMRPCPNCGGSDTAVYRWELSNNKFRASEDNLPLK